MKKTIKTKTKQSGITLIALVVTIVVLLILAGITITMVLGEDGILSQAKLAAQKTKDAEEQQAQDLDSLVGMVSDAINGKDPELLSDATSNHKIFSNTTSYDASGNKIEEGSESPDPEKKAAITVPAGFKITEGDLNSIDQGVVISDEAGNEFVWVPCGENDYKKHVYTTTEPGDDKGHNIEDKENGVDAGWNTWYYRSYNDWKGDEEQDKKNAESVKKYGGFYIARYEAGIPSNMTDVYVKPDNSSTKTYAVANKKNVTTFKPVSKKGAQAWNYISQENAKKVAERMYSGNTYVTSQLVDGIAWDTIVEWIAEEGELSDVVKKDSTEHGNYANNDSTNGNSPITVENVLYAEHIMNRKDNNQNNDGWAPAKNYKYGTFTSGWKENYTFNSETDNKDNYNGVKENDTYRLYVEMATGVSDSTKLKNIYDLGGNMYEWTTETGFHDGENRGDSSTTYAVLRGGSFVNYGSSSDRPVSSRNGNYTVGTTDPNFGFRVVLYVK